MDTSAQISPVEFYESFAGAILIIDKSGTEPLFSDEKNVSLFINFFRQKEITFSTSQLALKEEYISDTHRTSQKNKNMFAGDTVSELIHGSITSDNKKTDNFVISQATGTITSTYLDPAGFPVDIGDSSIQPLSLWDSTPFMQNNKNFVDKSVILEARRLKEKNKKTAVLANDHGIIKQCKLESTKHLRSVDILYWMKLCRFINYQKANKILKEWKSKNWVPVY